MQNVGQKESSDSPQKVKTVEVGQASLTPSSSPVMENTQVLATIQPNFMELSASEEEEVSEVESFILDQEDLEDAEPVLDTSKFLLSADTMEATDLRTVDPETQARLEALLEAAGIGKLSTADGKAYADPEVLRRLTTSVSSALDEAAAALTRMRAEQQGQLIQGDSSRSLAEACSDGDIGTVRKLLDEGRSVHETTEEGESLLSLACSAGYYELAQVLLAMRANVEDRGIKGDCTPLMEAASGGYVDIVRLLIANGADVNAQSSAGNTPLHYAACGGYEDVVRELISAGANVEEHNENGHTPLMEAASAGHVGVAKILLDAGAGINTHSNEFKESALTLACYKGHLEMVKFLLEAGADQEHKTDEMHTALMEASMDGHVEVARLLLDSGAQVNMPADSFESPLTLAACGGHVELANLLIERGANLEEVNDEGYTPLMEAAREGHEEMVALLLAHGADINAQTEETQETALTLACCGGFLEVGDFLIKAGANIELGCSTPLMEAAQEGHLELVKYLLKAGANVHAQTGTGDTALTYACENGHTDVADILLQHGAKLEHESEGGRTPLMKAARAGHLCTVQFLISKGADVNRQTSTNDHSVLSLASAGGHLGVVELLLTHGADPTHKLKDGSTMLIEAAKGGHTAVVNLLLDYPNSILSPTPDLTQLTPPETQLNISDMPRVPMQGLNNVVPPQDPDQLPLTSNFTPNVHPGVSGQVNLKDMNIPARTQEQLRQNMQKSLSNTLRANQRLKDSDLRQVKNNLQMSDIETDFGYDYEKGYTEGGSPVPLLEGDLKTSDKCEKLEAFINNMMRKAELLNTTREEQIVKKQQILEELQKVERELQEKAQAQLLLNFQHRLQQQRQPGQDANPVMFQTQNPGCANKVKQLNNNNTLDGSDFNCGPESLDSNNGDFSQCGSLGSVDGDSCLEHLEEESFHRHIAKQESIGSIDSTSSSEANPMAKVPRLGPGDGAEADTSSTASSVSVDGKAGSNGGASSLCSSDSGARENGSSIMGSTSQENSRSSRASSEEVDLSSVVPAVDAKQQQVAQQQADSGEYLTTSGTVEGVQEALPQGLQVGAALPEFPAGTVLPELPPGTVMPDAETLQQLQNIPLQTVLEQSVAAATSTAAALDQQHVQLQQQRQQLQAQLALQQQLQAELQQQLRLKQEQQQLQQQLKAQQALSQQLDLQALDNTTEALQLQQFQIQQPIGAVDQSLASQQPPTLQQLYAQQQKTQAQHAAFYHNNQMPQAQQRLAGGPQLTQQELLQQAQHLQKQLQLQQLAAQQQQKLTQQELLQQAQQLQQQLQHAQQLQQLAQQQQQQQKQLTHFQGAQAKKTKKKHTVTLPQQQQTANVPQLNNFTAPNSMHAGTLDTITPPPSTPLTPNPSPASPQIPPPRYPSLELDAQTESNHDTALTLACAGGHSELVSLLLSRGADIEHRDKKGFTPLILAATAGHSDVVEILLDHGADIEAQSERTKDTPLSLACSGGRYEVVELLLARNANKEHRNVSDYTPLSLAASGGYVNIIKLLLSHGAEINSRTGSKLGISPLMLAAMNGHTTAVKLLLDMGSDINAQIETNRNTALTLACFQGRHEVVSLLVDCKANIEHRAKTGLTPLMEAASGGYVEVGRVLLDKGADVNAPPVPSSRDTALTIASDKGHYRFVELLLTRGAAVDVKNKKGNSPLWLASNGGHLDVVQLLVNADADIDSQDNRKVSCVMAAFRKGHIKVVKWMVKHVTQFPSDQECMRFIATITDKELLKKCHQCMEILVSAKDRQAAEANKNASILLEQLDKEKSREENKRAAAARRRERRRKKKKEKQKDVPEKDSGKNSSPEPEGDYQSQEEKEGPGEEKDDEEEEEEEEEDEVVDVRIEPPSATTTTTIGTTIATQSRNVSNKKAKNESNSSDANTKNKNRRNRRNERERRPDNNRVPATLSITTSVQSPSPSTTSTSSSNSSNNSSQNHPQTHSHNPSHHHTHNNQNQNHNHNHSHNQNQKKKSDSISRSTGIGDLDDFGALPAPAKSLREKEKEKNRKSQADRNTSKINSLDTFGVPLIAPVKAGGGGGAGLKSPNVASPKKGHKREEGWKEVIRNVSSCRSKKVTVPSSAISRVIGRAGCNINAIREVSGAHIEVDKQKGSSDRIINIKGSVDATRQAHTLITALIKDPDKELEQILPKNKTKPSALATTANNTLIASNVWHNSMANGIGTTVTTTAHSSAVVTLAQMIHSVKTAGSGGRSTLPASNLLASSQAMAISLMRTQGSLKLGPPPASCQAPNQAWPNLSAPQTVAASSPKCSSGVIGPPASGTGPVQASGAKSPKTVARQLFPSDRKGGCVAVTTTARTTITYTTVSTANTKVVMATDPSLAAKVESKVPSGMIKVLQKAPGHAANKSSSSLNYTLNKTDQQPLPIKAGLGQNMPSAPVQPVSSLAPASGSFAVSTAPAEFSPFDNRFSRVTAQMLGKKEEPPVENRMNFASVAAAGVVPSSSNNLMSSASPVTSAPTPDLQQDPALPSKAPGYKAPGQRAASPQRSEMDPAKAPGYKGTMNIHPSVVHTSDQMEPSKAAMYMASLGISAPGNQMPHEANPARAPGYKAMPSPVHPLGDQVDLARAPGTIGYKMPGAPLGQPNLSPHAATVGPSAAPSAMELQFFNNMQHNRDEYSTPHQPMTLPKIESTLNPNAPDFTSRSLLLPHQMQQLTHSQHLSHNPGFGTTSPVLPASLAAQVAYRGPPPAGVIGQQGFNGVPQGGSSFLPPASSMMAGDLSSLINHPALIGAQGTVPSALPHQFSPLSAIARPASTPSVQTSKDESSMGAVSSEVSPSSSSAPSPTEQVKPGSEDRRLPRPIGTERAHKKPPGQSFSAGMGDGAGAGLWAFRHTDLASDWITMSAVSSVMTSSVASSTVLKPGLSADGEERPSSHPAMSPHLIPGGFPLDPGVIDQPADQAFQNPTLLLAGSGVAAMYAKGVPAAAGALPIPPVYTQPVIASDTVSSMWNQQAKLPPTDTASDNKTMWTKWTSPSM